MKIHKVRGGDLREALELARREHGEGALVLSRETSSDGAVLLSVSPVERAAAAHGAGAEPRSLPAGYEEVARRLRAHGAAEALVREVCCEAADHGQPELHPVDRVAQALGARFRIARLPMARGVSRVISLVGATGVGKTSSLIKLAARLMRTDRRIELATLDTRRVGAVEQLRAYGKLLGLPVHLVHADARLDAESLGLPGPELVLLDTTGRPAQDVPRLVELSRSLARSEAHIRHESLLVLPATASESALLEVAEACQDLCLCGVVITKTDETREPAAVLDLARELDLPIAFLSDGQDIGRDFHRARPEQLADLLIRGRIA